MNRSPLLNTGYVRLKECRHGPMLYLSTDRYVGQSLDRYGEFSQGEADLLGRLVQPGWTVLEVGANIGAHTVPLAKAVGPGGTVHAVEPQRVNFQILSANVAINALSNVHTYHAAMGRLASTIAVPRLSYAAAGNFGGLSLEHAAQRDRVPLIPADSLDLPRCELIKIEVEGLEGEVIAGAVRTIRRFRPVLYVENDHQEKSAALLRQLFALEYRLYWHLSPMFNPQNYFGDAEDVFAGAVSVNMLAVHASSPLCVAGFREITDPDETWSTVGGSRGESRGVPPDAGGGAVMVGLLPAQERAVVSADELNQAGIRLAQQGRLEEALLSFRRALQIQPGLAQSHNNLGIALQDQGRLEEAVASYRRALALKPDYPVAYNNLGTALKEQRKLDEAADCFRRALQLKPDDLMACSNLANALREQGQLAEAAACYRRALELKPDYPEGYADLGAVLRDLGRVDEAVACSRRALELKPDLVAAWSNLGIALRDQGSLDEAVACQRRALELKPDFAASHVNLGIILAEQGRFAEAMACYRRAVEIKPDSAEAQNNLGSVLIRLGQPEEAAACCRRALQQKPDYAEALSNLGAAFQDLGKKDESLACYHRAVELEPGNSDAHNNLGVAFKNLGKLDEAIACYQRALELKPDNASAHNNLGIAFLEQRKLDEAVACQRRALELKPDNADTHNNLGAAFKEQGKLDEAVACYRRALELKPDYADAHSNLGAAFQEQGKLDEALACYARALELKPDNPGTHNNRALLRLLLGDFQEGWPESESRWDIKGFRRRPFYQPLWDGRPLEGKTILLHSEQGLGDTIQFVRYAPLVKQAGARVLLECQKPLVRLLAGCRGVDELLGRGDDLPPFDFHAPLLSLPGILHTSLETIPADVPYLFADPPLVEHWRGELESIAGFKVGIVWRGSPVFRNDRARSFPLSCFEPLAGLPDVRLISLQKGAGVEQLQDLAGRFPVTELGSRLDDFTDTAAAMANLDLVIACDTAVAHLAGAMRLPVWVAIPFIPDWRWMLDRDDSPWYPSVRLFRQKKPGDWASVFDQMKTAIALDLQERKT